MSKRKFSGSISGKGYYIALILCLVAIGISGYLYYQNTEEADTPVSAAEDPGVAVAATDPATQTPTSTDTTQPTQSQTPQKRTWPVAGETVTGHAVDALSYNQTTRDWRTHDGVDIAAAAGTQVCAAGDGVVYTVYEDETLGMTVVIRHEEGYTTRYSSLAQQVSVKPGDPVAAGDPIGQVGNTALLENAIGDHVHFSVSCNGQPVDPAQFVQP